VPTPTLKAAPTLRSDASKPHVAKRYDNPANAPAAERKLLAAMRERPGLSAASLAKVVGAGLSTTKERLRRMGAQELVEKAPDGHWRVKGEEPRPAAPREEPGPRGTPYSAAVGLTAEEKSYAPWVRPIGDYERRETTIVEGLRYG
jgi:hypothetical protein